MPLIGGVVALSETDPVELLRGQGGDHGVGAARLLPEPTQGPDPEPRNLPGGQGQFGPHRLLGTVDVVEPQQDPGA